MLRIIDKQDLTKIYHKRERYYLVLNDELNNISLQNEETLKRLKTDCKNYKLRVTSDYNNVDDVVFLTTMGGARAEVLMFKPYNVVSSDAFELCIYYISERSGLVYEIYFEENYISGVNDKFFNHISRDEIYDISNMAPKIKLKGKACIENKSFVVNEMRRSGGIKILGIKEIPFVDYNLYVKDINNDLVDIRKILGGSIYIMNDMFIEPKKCKHLDYSKIELKDVKIVKNSNFFADTDYYTFPVLNLNEILEFHFVPNWIKILDLSYCINDISEKCELNFVFNYGIIFLLVIPKGCIELKRKLFAVYNNKIIKLIDLGTTNRDDIEKLYAKLVITHRKGNFVVGV